MTTAAEPSTFEEPMARCEEIEIDAVIEGALVIVLNILHVTKTQHQK